MADQNSSVEKADFYSEILSPSELFAARSRSHKLPVRGQKEFLPDASQRQQARMRQSLDEHWSLVCEERVERLGNLVRAVWMPDDSTVELQTPAGKFWQTMGFSANGKQCLHPEEALYLMECGNLQVFHRELPLSIQEAYERFLSSKTVGLQQYQVFSHLKRLGYVVNRFDASSVPSQYERRLNLPASRDRGGRRLKRKRSLSSSPTHSHAEGPGAEEKEEEEEEKKEREDREEREDSGEKERDGEEEKSEDPPSALTAAQRQDVATAAPPNPAPSAEGGRARSWWTEAEDAPPPAPDPPPPPPPHPHPSSSRWDWGSLPFPDLGSRRGGPPVSLSSPDPSLLPGSLAVGACDVAPWLRRLSLRQVRTSRSERERERHGDRHRRRGVNDDREVRRCRDWAEYRELRARRSGRSHRDRPAHLWEGKVTPLHDPGQHASTGELLEKISVIGSSRLLEGTPREGGESAGWRLSFDVYQSDTVAEFKKSSPGRPYTRMCVNSFDGPVPDLRAVQQLTEQSGEIPVTFAVVDHGHVSFYCFKDFQLPVDSAH